MAFAPNNSSLLSNQDTNQFLVIHFFFREFQPMTSAPDNNSSLSEKKHY